MLAVESREPDVEFAHLKQTTLSAHGQTYVIHICYLMLTQQYRAYVFCNGEFLAWVLDPEIDHATPPQSQTGIRISEQLIEDTAAEIEANHLDVYTYFLREKNIENRP